MNDYTCTDVLNAPVDCVGTERCATYVAILAHHQSKEELDSFANAVCIMPKFQDVLAAAAEFEAHGATILYKAGDVHLGTEFKERCGKLSSTVHTGDPFQPTARRMYELVELLGGFVHVIMTPITGFSQETPMKIAMIKKYGIKFDNLARGPVGTPLKKHKRITANRFVKV